ncbi:MAG: hypothetical protein QOE05_317 [Actinomycetota bacterium]|jgi:hypothetical protein|nr:hypothetical protein [Actinomycetota bacterium]
MGLAVSVALAVLVLPSALDLPQTNPTQTVEYAPVPPSDSDEPPPPGNVATLGLGTSDTTSGDSLGGDQGSIGEPPPPPPGPGGAGTVPRTKRCVGNPPRQTEDQMAPPCVGYFTGDNGGATYQGVTRGEIVVLFYIDATQKLSTDDGTSDQTTLRGKYVDLKSPPKSDDTVDVRNLRRFQRFFNDRFQTYNRYVHFYAYFSTADADDNITPETRRADAAANYAKLRPFTVLTSELKSGFEDSYIDSMAGHGVLVFGSASGSQPAAFYKKHPRLVWSYQPTIETRAALYSSYVCTKVRAQPVVDSGNQGENGAARVYGLLSTSDPAHPELQLYARLVQRSLSQCGVSPKVKATFPIAGRTYQTQQEDAAATYAKSNMAQFKNEHVTTILWVGGYETDQSRAAGNLQYYPEVILAGDGYLEGNFDNTHQDQTFWSHATVVTPVPMILENDRDPCVQSIRQTDPSAGPQDTTWACTGTTFYVDTRQLFTGIQVAGPKLSPDSIDQGFHAIPAVQSKDPSTPACYYNTGDYTCVKDGTAEHWDPQGAPPGIATKGCWRMNMGGARFTDGTWPSGNIDRGRRPDNPCNRYSPAPLIL